MEPTAVMASALTTLSNVMVNAMATMFPVETNVQTPIVSTQAVTISVSIFLNQMKMVNVLEVELYADQTSV